ncbi:hypothetical protein SAY87_027092 [Trapa incisa]|uniref:Peroxisomal membrane protein PEX14 n=1 Tax=Trapa incisa TaxID=236973 RepID=A0AAN7GYS8_9MYRT|nr:hypothetical protein SAY87_027092 [Trapa incisa]
MLNSKLQEKKFIGEIMNLLDVQLCEIKSVGVTVKNLQGQANSHAEKPLSNVTFQLRPQFQGSTGTTVQILYSSSISGALCSTLDKNMEIMGMVQRGERPPNIKGIDDSHPYPNQPIFNPSLNPPMKGDKSVPWLQPANNLRFTELENGSQRTGSYDQFTKRSWFHPPQPSPVAMPEAAEAIRRPKPTIR